MWVLGIKLRSPEEQSEPLTTEPSVQPRSSAFELFCVMGTAGLIFMQPFAHCILMRGIRLWVFSQDPIFATSEVCGHMLEWCLSVPMPKLAQ